MNKSTMNVVPWDESTATPISDLAAIRQAAITSHSNEVSLHPAFAELIRTQADFDGYVNDKRLPDGVTAEQVERAIAAIERSNVHFVAKQLVLSNLRQMVAGTPHLNAPAAK